MTIQTIQTLNDGTAHYRQSTPLEGALYVLHFDFNSRESKWYLSVHDVNDEPIYGLVGLKLVQNWFPTRLSTSLDRPPGEFLVVSNVQIDPGLNDLGDGTSLVYVPLADLEAITP